MPSLVLSSVSFRWPDGSVALDRVSGSFGDGRTGLVGRNGTGKSTLLKLAAGVLAPTDGTITGDGEVAYLPQRLTLDVDAGVADLLGITEPLTALRAIESGDADPRHFDAVGDDWDIEARAHAALAEAGLPPEALDRTVGTLSGGEAILAATLGLRMRRAPITLLDEPTNNLDRDARERLYGVVRAWRGALVVVSHDVRLLELMDDTAELHAHELSVFGGPYSEWRAWLETEQRAAQQAEIDAKKSLAKEKRQRIEAETKLAGRARAAHRAEVEKRVPKIVAHGRRQAAQVSAGRLRTEVAEKEAEARAEHDAAQQRVRDDDSVRLDLPDPDVPPSRRIATFASGAAAPDPDVAEPDGARPSAAAATAPAGSADTAAAAARIAERQWIVQGPERIALIGPNGSGKTTLLHALVGALIPGSDKTAAPASSRIGAASATASSGTSPARWLTSIASATCRSGWTGSTTMRACSTRCAQRRRTCRIASCATDSRDSSSGVRRSTGRFARCRAASGSGCCWPGCCSPTRRRSCSFSTSPPTTSISIRSTSWSERCRPSAARSWWSATTMPSSRGSASI